MVLAVAQAGPGDGASVALRLSTARLGRPFHASLDDADAAVAGASSCQAMPILPSDPTPMYEVHALVGLPLCMAQVAGFLLACLTASPSDTIQACRRTTSGAASSSSSSCLWADLLQSVGLSPSISAWLEDQLRPCWASPTNQGDGLCRLTARLPSGDKASAAWVVAVEWLGVQDLALQLLHRAALSAREEEEHGRHDQAAVMVEVQVVVTCLEQHAGCPSLNDLAVLRLCRWLRPVLAEQREGGQPAWTEQLLKVHGPRLLALLPALLVRHQDHIPSKPRPQQQVQSPSHPRGLVIGRRCSPPLTSSPATLLFPAAQALSPASIVGHSARVALAAQ